MKPCNIRYVLGRQDKHRVHNNIDPIPYIAPPGVCIAVSARAKAIEQACAKSFVECTCDNMAVVLAPKNDYHVSRIITELTPDLTPVNLTQVTSDSYYTYDESEQTEQREQPQSAQMDLEEGKEIKEEIGEEIREEKNVKSEQDRQSEQSERVSNSSKPSSRHDKAQSQILPSPRPLCEPDLDILAIGPISQPVLGSSAEYNGKKPVTCRNVTYKNTSFNVPYKETTETELITRIIAPLAFPRLLRLDGIGFQKMSQNMNIKEPQDIPVLLALEVLPIVLNLVIYDPDFYLFSLVKLPSRGPFEFSRDAFTKLTEKLTREVQRLSNHTEYSEAQSVDACIDKIVSIAANRSESISGLTILASLIYSVIGNEAHDGISKYKTLCGNSSSSDTSSSQMSLGPESQSEPTHASVERACRYLPYFLLAFTTVLFKQFYAMHDISLTDIQNNVFRESLRRLISTCLFVLLCSLTPKYFELWNRSSASDWHSQSSALYSKTYHVAVSTIFRYIDGWVYPAISPKISTCRKSSYLFKFFKCFGNYAVMQSFIYHYNFQQAWMRPNSKPNMLFLHELGNILNQTDFNFAPTFAKSCAGDLSMHAYSVLTCQAFGLAKGTVQLQQNVILECFNNIIYTIQANTQSSAYLKECVEIVLKLIKGTETKERTQRIETVTDSIVRLHNRIGALFEDGCMEPSAAGMMPVPVLDETNQAPSILISIILGFTLNIMVHIAGKVSDTMHVFVQSLDDVVIIIYALALYSFMIEEWPENRGRAKVYIFNSSHNFNGIMMSIYNRLVKLHNMRTTSTVSSTPSRRKVKDGSKSTATQPQYIAIISLVLPDTTVKEESATRESEVRLRIIVDTGVPSTEAAARASLISNVPCQLSVFKQLLLYSEKLATLLL